MSKVPYGLKSFDATFRAIQRPPVSPFTDYRLDPSIGVLARDGRTVYYAHLDLSASDRKVVLDDYIYIESEDLSEIKAYVNAHRAQELHQ